MEGELREILEELRGAKSVVSRLEDRVEGLINIISRANKPKTHEEYSKNVLSTDGSKTADASIMDSLNKEKQLLQTEVTLLGLPCIAWIRNTDNHGNLTATDDKQEVTLRLDKNTGIFHVKSFNTTFMSMFTKSNGIPNEFSVNDVLACYAGAGMADVNVDEEEELRTMTLEVVNNNNNVSSNIPSRYCFRCETITARDKALMALVLFRQQWKEKGRSSNTSGNNDGTNSGDSSNSRRHSAPSVPLDMLQRTSSDSESILSPNRDIAYDSIFGENESAINGPPVEGKNVMSLGNMTNGVSSNGNSSDRARKSLSSLPVEAMQMMSNPLADNLTRLSANKSKNRLRNSANVSTDGSVSSNNSTIGNFSGIAQEMLSIDSPVPPDRIQEKEDD